MTYCMAPFRNVYINNKKSRPCCWYERRELSNQTDMLSEIPDIFYSEEFAHIRQDMLDKNSEHSGCWKCQMHEEKGGVSHRLLWNKREKNSEITTLTDLDLYMGNLCNLACVSCSSHNSSKWIAQEQKIFGTAQKNKQDDIDINLTWDLVKNLKRIKLAGGEVTIMPNHMKLLQQLIDFDVAKNITLVYVVNNTTDPTQFTEMFNKFKCIEFILSIDGINEVSDYVRYLSEWHELESNINKAIDMNISVSVNCVVSILNVYHLPEILKWWKNRGDILFRILDYPDILSIKHLTTEQRHITIDKVSEYSELQHIAKALSEYPPGDFKKFTKYIDKIDQHRNNNFFGINPQYLTEEEIQ